jgi:hypothetical protein
LVLGPCIRWVFKDLKHKPSIGKAIKNFEPDSGLPSARTLVEYKFVASDGDVKRIADEVLADTRAYVSKEWDKFIYLIYETRRLKHESQWMELLRSSSVDDNTQIVVICGEEPTDGVEKIGSAQGNAVLTRRPIMKALERAALSKRRGCCVCARHARIRARRPLRARRRPSAG